MTGEAARSKPPEAGSPQLVAQRYRVEREIGRGGMATIYEVTGLMTERPPLPSSCSTT